jgi:hypothetical protein
MALVQEPPAELGTGAGPVGEEVQRGVPDPYVGIGVEQVVAATRGKGVPHAEGKTLQSLEGHLEGLAPAQVDTSPETSRPEGLHPGDGRVAHGLKLMARAGLGDTSTGDQSPLWTYQRPSRRSRYRVT